MTKNYINIASLIVRIVVGAVFVYGAVSKAVDIEGFAKEIFAYELMSPFLCHVMAVTLPWIELVGGIMLMVGVKVRANALIMLFWLVLFIGAVGIAMIKGLNIDCGCHGVGAEKVGFTKILQNTGLAAGSIFVFLLPGDWHFDKK